MDHIFAAPWRLHCLCQAVILHCLCGISASGNKCLTLTPNPKVGQQTSWTVHVHSITLQPSLSRFHPVSRNAPHEAPVPVWSPQNQVLLARPAFVVWSYVILWPIPVVALEQSIFNQSLAVATDFTCLRCQSQKLDVTKEFDTPTLVSTALSVNARQVLEDLGHFDLWPSSLYSK